MEQPDRSAWVHFSGNGTASLKSNSIIPESPDHFLSSQDHHQLIVAGEFDIKTGRESSSGRQAGGGVIELFVVCCRYSPHQLGCSKRRATLLR